MSYNTSNTIVSILYWAASCTRIILSIGLGASQISAGSLNNFGGYIEQDVSEVDI